jgi:hypothetical protein
MTDERIIAYLLEELPEEEAEQFEDECFAQERWPEQLRLVEEDLIDNYLRNELGPELRRRFEDNYLTTAARHERVGLAAALLRHVDETQAAAQEPVAAQETVAVEERVAVEEPVAVAKPVAVAPAVASPEPTWAERLRAFWSSQSWQLRAVAAILVLALIPGAIWVARNRARSPQTFATLTLNISAGNRGDGAQTAKVTLPPEADALKLSLTLPEPSTPTARYRVELLNEKGETQPLEIAGQDAQSVKTVIPAAQLARGRYALKLFKSDGDGSEQRVSGSYLFTVE